MVLMMREKDPFLPLQDEVRYHMQLLHPSSGLTGLERQAAHWHGPHAFAPVRPTDVTFPFGGNIETRENSLHPQQKAAPSSACSLSLEICGNCFHLSI